MAKKGVKESLKLLSMANKIRVTETAGDAYCIEFVDCRIENPVSALVEILENGNAKASYYVEGYPDMHEQTSKFRINFDQLSELKKVVSLFISEKSDYSE